MSDSEQGGLCALERLPNELLDQILSEVNKAYSEEALWIAISTSEDIPDSKSQRASTSHSWPTKHLCLTSRRLNAVATPFLYSAIIDYPPTPHDYDCQHVEDTILLLRTLDERPDLLNHVRRVVLHHTGRGHWRQYASGAVSRHRWRVGFAERVLTMLKCHAGSLSMLVWNENGMLNKETSEQRASIISSIIECSAMTLKKLSVDSYKPGELPPSPTEQALSPMPKILGPADSDSPTSNPIYLSGMTWQSGPFTSTAQQLKHVRVTQKPYHTILPILSSCPRLTTLEICIDGTAGLMRQRRCSPRDWDWDTWIAAIRDAGDLTRTLVKLKLDARRDTLPMIAAKEFPEPVKNENLCDFTRLEELRIHQSLLLGWDRRRHALTVRRLIKIVPKQISTLGLICYQDAFFEVILCCFEGSLDELKDLKQIELHVDKTCTPATSPGFFKPNIARDRMDKMRARCSGFPGEVTGSLCSIPEKLANP